MVLSAQHKEPSQRPNTAVAQIRARVAATTMQGVNHYTSTAHSKDAGNWCVSFNIFDAKYSQYFLALFLNNYRFLHFSLCQVLFLHFSLPILIQNKKPFSSLRIWPVHLHKPLGRSPCLQSCLSYFFPVSWRFPFGLDPFPAPSHWPYGPHWRQNAERGWIEPWSLSCTDGAL